MRRLLDASAIAACVMYPLQVYAGLRFLSPRMLAVLGAAFFLPAGMRCTVKAGAPDARSCSGWPAPWPC